MEDNVILFENRRQPNFLKMEGNLKFFENGRHEFLKMEDINF
jgi:hypothetical protein